LKAGPGGHCKREGSGTTLRGWFYQVRERLVAGWQKDDRQPGRTISSIKRHMGNDFKVRLMVRNIQDIFMILGKLVDAKHIW
jgi:hypothetical protein